MLIQTRSVVLISLIVSGCATTGGSGLAVKRLDSNTFEVTTHVISGLSDKDGVQKKNDQIATAYCAEKRLPMSVIERRGYDGVASQDVLRFRCGGALVAKPTRGA